MCVTLKMFSLKLPGLSPQGEIDFEIELIPRSQPISKAPYHMGPTKLKEQNLVRELLHKEFIKPSVTMGAQFYCEEKEWNLEIVYRLQGVKYD